MPWFKVDDALAFHMKALAAGNRALGLWVRAGSWSMQQLSDGFVPSGIVPALGGNHEDVGALVEAGLWHVTEGGWQFHDWAEYQPTRAQLEAEREATRERVAKHREQRRMNGNSNGVGNGVTTPVSNGVSTPAPSHPIPSRTSNEVLTPRKRGTRLPDGWTPDAELIEQMRLECPTVDLRAEHRVFTDYWVAQPGQKGVKTDWDATWRNWMRRAQTQRQSSARPTRGQENLAYLQSLTTDFDEREAIGQ